MHSTLKRGFLLCLCLTPLAPFVRAAEPAAPAGASQMLELLGGELKYSMEKLAMPDGTKPYYLSYTVTDRQTVGIQTAMGALTDDADRRTRWLDVDVRVGDYNIDNTHKLRGMGGGSSGSLGGGGELSLADDADAIRHAVWLATDTAFKSAAEKFQRVQTDLKTKVEEDDKSGDFTKEQPNTYTEPEVSLKLDRAKWVETLRKVSAVAREYPLIYSSQITLGASVENRYMVSSEGTRLQTGRKLIRVAVSAETKAEDGMELGQSFIFDAAEEGQLPSEAQIVEAFKKVIDQTLALRKAPLVEPYIGPAILRNRASGVFFHEIFGHRIEGHRQKDVEEGQTFTKKIGEPVLPDFITVHDNPTLAGFKGQNLRGFYKYDDEGVTATDVMLVDKGILKTFLMSRSPLDKFPQSNGHGRRDTGRSAVSRQGNLMVESAKTMSFDKLRETLIAECKKQDKPYGLLFEDITGGFTGTRRSGAQSFKVLPVVVYRVYADGRPDELVRGVDLVGTPLTCFSKIVAAGDDPAVFNGSCGAESGWVPVSAVSPSILVSQIEVEKRKREQEKPPILPSPIAEKSTGETPKGEDALTTALEDEIKRAMTLQMEDLEKPYFVQFDVDATEGCQLSAAYGALTGASESRSRSFRSQIRVGKMELDNTNFMGGSGMGGGSSAELPVDDDYLAIRQAIWQATDSDYKAAVETLTQKRAYMKDKNIVDRPNDFSPAPKVEKLEPVAKLNFDRAAWTKNLERISGHFKQYAQIQESSVRIVAMSQNSYLFNTEGTRLRDGDTGAFLMISASGQAEDGMRLSDSRLYTGSSTADFPPVDKILADIDALVADLTAAMKAPMLDHYSGPILFDGLPSTQVFATLLAGGLSGRPDPVGSSSRSPADNFETKLGTRILPKSFQIWDDPTAKKYADTLLAGEYRYDDEGVPPAKVELVKDGKLETLCMSRAPTKKITGTNGHGRRLSGGAVRASVANLFIESKDGVSDEELKKELISAAKDAGLEFAVRVKALRGTSSNRGRAIGDPLVAYKVFVADGREEPFRGCQFGTTDVTVLKKILAAGDKPYVRNGPNLTLIAPPILLEELELSKIDQEYDKPPILKAPLSR